MQPMMVSELWIYPIKSAQGIRVQEVQLTGRGPAHDRRWMIVGERGKFLTQRQFPQLSQLIVEVAEDGLLLHTPSLPRIQIATPSAETPPMEVKVWQDVCSALPAAEEASQWISNFLGHPVTLVYMGDNCNRPLHSLKNSSQTLSFADGYPYHLITQPSLDDLNHRIPNENLMALNFRPNIVIQGDFPAFAEDQWERVQIGESRFRCIRWCPRCQVTTIHPYIGVRQGPEPLQTLDQFRKWREQVWFGQNAVLETGTTLRVGDAVVVESQTDRSFVEMQQADVQG